MESGNRRPKVETFTERKGNNTRNLWKAILCEEKMPAVAVELIDNSTMLY